MHTSRLHWLIAVLLPLLTLPVTAQDSDPLERRARDVAALFSEAGEAYAQYFDDAFLEQVPPDQLDAIFSDLRSRTGPVSAVVPAERRSATSGQFRFHTEGGFSVPVDLAINPQPPHRIMGLWLSAPVPLSSTFDALHDRLAQLPGTVGMIAMRLAPEPAVIAELNADTSLALGSAFKLFVLAEVERAVADGALRWDSVLILQPEWRSLPSGILQNWPDGAPITIHTLASLMISLSDNTATDALIHILDRDRVESAVERLAPASADRNRPFLTTREVFQLKSEPESELTERYLAADADARRQILAEEGLPPTESLMPFADGMPALIRELEWFASAREMAGVLDVLRTGDDDVAREIMAINSGIQLDDDAWPYIGFKGGSEPGVLNLSYLLRSASGEWYAVVATWNDPSAPVQTETLVGLVQRAIELLNDEHDS